MLNLILRARNFSALSCGLLLLAACSDSNNALRGFNAADTVESTIEFSQPPLILTSRAIDRTLLRILVTVNGITSGLERNGESWSGTVQVPQGELVNMEVVWLQDSLELASHSTQILSVNSDVVINIGPDQYDATQYDLDGDGLNNLSELRNDSSPWDYDSPGINNSINIELAAESFDFDGDGSTDDTDNCVTVSNFDQDDIDGDGIGDLCDAYNSTSSVPEILSANVEGQIRLDREIQIVSASAADVPGATSIGIRSYLGEYWNGSTERDLITELVDDQGRVYMGQTITNESEGFESGGIITNTDWFYVYGPSQNLNVRISERVPGEPDSTIRLAETASASFLNPHEISIGSGTIQLASPIQVEQTTNEQGSTKFEFVFTLEESSGNSASAKIFVDVSADNGRTYPTVSNSSPWNDNKGVTIFSPDQRVQFRIPIELDTGGEVLLPGTYTAYVGAWRFNQMNPELYASFEYIDLDARNTFGDKISFVLP
jgi:hypothetical protein